MTDETTENRRTTLVIIEEMIIAIAYKRFAFNEEVAIDEAITLERKLSKKMSNNLEQEFNQDTLDMLYYAADKLVNLYAKIVEKDDFRIDKRKSKINYIHAAEFEYRIVEEKLKRRSENKLRFQFFGDSDTNELLAKLNYLINVECHKNKEAKNRLKAKSSGKYMC